MSFPPKEKFSEDLGPVVYSTGLKKCKNTILIFQVKIDTFQLYNNTFFVGLKLCVYISIREYRECLIGINLKELVLSIDQTHFKKKY